MSSLLIIFLAKYEQEKNEDWVYKKRKKEFALEILKKKREKNVEFSENIFEELNFDF